MTHVLAIETSTDVVSVAFGSDGAPVSLWSVPAERRHAEALVPMIRALAAETGIALDRLAAVAVGVGPGLFTGLRVGVTTAKVMAFALGIPVVGVRSLDLVAYPLRYTDREIVAVIDARRREVFHARYRPVPGGLQRLTEDAVNSPGELVADLEANPAPLLLAGNGVARYREVFARLERAVDAGPSFATPSAAALVELGTARVRREEFSGPGELRPHYVRESDAVIQWERAGVSWFG